MSELWVVCIYHEAAWSLRAILGPHRAVRIRVGHMSCSQLKGP